MSYINKYILPGESVLIQERMTKKRYLTAILLLAIGSVLGILTQGGILAFIISISSFFVALITAKERWSCEFVVTNKRCIMKTGIIRVNVLDISLDKCEGVAYNQTIFGRILNYGDILTSTGGITNVAKCLDNPVAIRNRMNEIIEAYKKTL